MCLRQVARLAVATHLLGFASAVVTQPEKRQSTYFNPELYHVGLLQHWQVPVLSLADLIARSNIIVWGKVAQILGSVETLDIVEENRPKDIKYIHTDVLFKVKEYLGPNQLPFDQLVIRHTGGSLGNIANIVKEQEHLSVGEEVIIFRLWQHQDLAQVPEGFVREQYFMFRPRSKFSRTSGRQDYLPDFPGPATNLKAIRHEIAKLKF